MTLRQGGAGDVPLLFSLFDEAVEWMVARGQSGQWGSQPPSTDPAWRGRIEAMPGQMELVILERAGRAVAALGIGDHPQWVRPIAEPELYIHLLISRRSESGQDLGGRLVREALREAAARGASVLRVDCWAEAPGLVGWYQRQGFSPAGTFGGPGEWKGQILSQPVPPVRA